MGNHTEDQYFLALDQGTQSTRAAVVRSDGRIVSIACETVGTKRLVDGRVEQSPEEILKSLRVTIAKVLEQHGGMIQAAGMATQRSSVVAWRRSTCEPLSPVISWQDTRGQAFVESLSTAQREQIQRLTGLPVSAHYGATKLRWLIEQEDVAALIKEGDCVVGPLASFLLANLVAAEHLAEVDYANGGRMQLMNLQQRCWDRELLELFGIPLTVLPTLRPNRFEYGHLKDTVVPFVLLQGDQTAAACGLVRDADSRTARVNVGTGAFILAELEKGDLGGDSRMLRSIYHSDMERTKYLIEGTVNGAGAALNWAADQLGVARQSIAAKLDQWLVVPDQPLIFINCVGGLGSPYWRPAGTSVQENVWVNLNGEYVADPEAETAMAAVAESIIFLLAVNLGCMQGMGCEIERVSIGGGLSRSDAMCQRLADLTGVLVERGNVVEATLLGVTAMLRGGGEDGPAASVETFTPRSSDDLRVRYRAFCALMNETDG
ncbi:MAG: FGGY family carbohydrate kinase [Planctomycetota bacterium]